MYIDWILARDIPKEFKKMAVPENRWVAVNAIKTKTFRILRKKTSKPGRYKSGQMIVRDLHISNSTLGWWAFVRYRQKPLLVKLDPTASRPVCLKSLDPNNDMLDLTKTDTIDRSLRQNLGLSRTEVKNKLEAISSWLQKQSPLKS